MIGVQVRINNTDLIANIQAIRIKPIHRNPEPGELCTYQTRIYNQDYKKLNFPFGDGVALAQKLLELYSNTSEDTILGFKQAEEEERVAKMLKQLNADVGRVC